MVLLAVKFTPNIVLGYDLIMRERITGSLLMADWIVVALRWLGVVSLAAILAWGNGFDINALFAIGVAVAANLVFTGLLLYEIRLPYHKYSVIGVDALLAGVFFLLTGTNNGPLVWAGLLPLFTGTFYLGTRGGLGIAIILIAIEAIGVASFTSLDSAMDLIVLPGVSFIGIGLGLGVVAEFIGGNLSRRRLLELSKVQESDRKHRERVSALYKITTTLSATLNYQKVLDMALDLSSSALADPDESSAKLISAFYLYEGDTLIVGSARRFTPADWKAELYGKEGFLKKAIRSGESRVMTNPDQDPELVRVVSLRSSGAVYCYPLRSSMKIYGVILFGHPDEDYFDDSRQEILEIVGRQARVAMENALLYSDLEEEKERMMSIQEEARKKLARNLHDGPTQSVAAIAMRVNFARRLMEKDPKAAGDELFKIEDLARRTTKEIRHMLFTLRPLVLESSGLVAALESMAEKMNETFDQNVIIEADKNLVEEIEMSKQGVVFYIAEEAVNNARKHAEAEHIWVRLKFLQEDMALLEVQDDGVGFNVGSVNSGYENRGSLGMVNMRERTELVNGLLRMQSKEGVGTRIRVWIPLTEDAAQELRQGVQQ